MIASKKKSGEGIRIMMGMKLDRTVVAVLAFAVLATTAVYLRYGVSVAASTDVVETVSLFDSCKNVKFAFRNGRRVDIQVTKVQYFNSTDGKWRTESLSYNTCRPGQSCYTGGDNLSSAEGDNITKIKYEFKERMGNGWTGGFISQEFRPESPACRANKQYGDSFAWAIVGTTTGSNTLGDSCADVTFVVWNKTGDSSNLLSRYDVKIDKVKYYNRNSGKWKTEAVNNVTCGPDQKCTVGPDTLADADGEDITKIIFVYKTHAAADPGFALGEWSGPYESKTFVPTDARCRPAKVYGLGAEWAITKGASSSNSTTGGSGRRVPSAIDGANINSGAAPTNMTTTTVKKPRAKGTKKGTKSGSNNTPSASSGPNVSVPVTNTGATMTNTKPVKKQKRKAKKP